MEKKVLENINVKNFTAPSQQVYTLGQNLRLGIVGRGFVGGAVSHGFNTKYVEQYIVDPRFSDLKLKDLVNKDPHVIFICLPTPSRLTDSIKGPIGSVDSDLIDATLNSLSSMDYTGIIVIKSTVAPTVLQSFRDDFTKLNIVYNPEFLTEVNANDDFINPPFQIFGGDWDDCTRIEQIYIKYSLVRPSPTFKLDIKAASFLKYTINSWLATKVVFFNELRKLYATYDMSTPWSEFIGVLAHEPRVGSSHMNVPGPDGQFGFGGNCFPKDTKAFVEESRNSALLELLEKAIEINNNMRANT
jgi:nucleotide sugar dehydrogenase